MTLTPALTQHVRQHVTLPEEVKDGVLVFRVGRLWLRGATAPAATAATAL